MTENSNDQELLINPKGYGTFIPECEADDDDNQKALFKKDDDEQTVNVKVGYDNVLEEIGEFGPWQQWLYLLFWIPPAVSGAIFMLGTFTSKYKYMVTIMYHSSLSSKCVYF